MAVFPSYFALSAQTNHQNIRSKLFLTCIPEGEYNNCLQIDPFAEVPSLIARFVVERARDWNLVHIRSCYNNRYWRRSGNWVAAHVSERQEDTREDNCTLFRPEWIGNSEITLTHVRSGLGLGLYSMYSSSLLYLYHIGNGYQPVRFKVVDYEMLVRLPKRVIFKGDSGQYLQGQWLKPNPNASGYPFPHIDYVFPALGVVEAAGGLIAEAVKCKMQKSCNYNRYYSKDGVKRSAHYEITHYNGFIRIKSLYYGKFLRALGDGGRIYGDVDDISINNPNTLFEVINRGGNKINLRNLGYNKVCTRKSNGLVKDCLFASQHHAVPESLLHVEEPVTNRRFYVEYKLDDARITGEQVFPTNTQPFITNNSNDKGEYMRNVDIQKTRTTKWSNTAAVTKNMEVVLNFKVPKYFEGRIQLSNQHSQKHSFEEESKDSVTVTEQMKIIVPPKTQVMLKTSIKQITYEIPYSSFQTDVYTTGEEDTILVNDGLCQGIESFVCYSTEETSLVPRSRWTSFFR